MSRMHRSTQLIALGMIALLMGVTGVLQQEKSVSAFQTTSGSWTWTTNGTATVVDGTTWYLGSTRSTTLQSGLTVNVSVSGPEMGITATDQLMSARGGAVGHFFSDSIVSTTGVQMMTNDGSCTYGNVCTNRGEFTVSFSSPVTNPIISFTGLGGGGANGNTSGSKTVTWSEFDLVTPNVTLNRLAGSNMQIVNGTHIEPVTKNPASSCSVSSDSTYGATASASCGSVQIVGTLSTVSFSADLGTRNNAAAYTGPNRNEDGWTLVVSVNEDFGLAPASYDSSPASHVVGSLMMGSVVTADQTTTKNPTTNPDAVSAGTAITSDDGTNAFTGSVAFGSAGQSFTATVDLLGVDQNATLCGWIDFNGNGTFDNTTERACAAPTQGSTSAQLTWTIPATVAADGVTYARLRLSYDPAANSPTGKVASGEVEDYSIQATFSANSVTTTTAAPTTTVVSTTTIAPTTTLAPTTTTPVTTTAAPTTTLVANVVTSTSTTVAQTESQEVAPNESHENMPQTGASFLAPLLLLAYALILMGFAIRRVEKLKR